MRSSGLVQRLLTPPGLRSQPRAFEPGRPDGDVAWAKVFPKQGTTPYLSRKGTAVIRKHNRRAAKAAFTIAMGVALILGGAAAAPAAESQATPIIVGAKNFPEQYVLGQLYRQALIAKGFKVQYKENIGSTRLIDAALKSGKVTLYPEHGDHAAQSPSQAKRRCRLPLRPPTSSRSSCTSGVDRPCFARRRSRTVT